MERVIASALAVWMLSSPLFAAETLDAKNNETPIHIPANPQAIAKIPAGFHYDMMLCMILCVI